MPESFAACASGSPETHRIDFTLRVEEVCVGAAQSSDLCQALAVCVLRNQVSRGGSAPRLALQLVLFVCCHRTPRTSQTEPLKSLGRRKAANPRKKFPQHQPVDRVHQQIPETALSKTRFFMSRGFFYYFFSDLKILQPDEIDSLTRIVSCRTLQHPKVGIEFVKEIRVETCLNGSLFRFGCAPPCL